MFSSNFMTRMSIWYNPNLDSLLDKTYITGHKVKVYNKATQEFEEIKLNYIKALKLALRGFVEIDKRRYQGWSDSIPFYVYSCKAKDGKKVFMLDYPHGYDSTLDCKL